MLKGAELSYLLHLREEIVEREVRLAQLLLHLLGFFRIERGLRLLDEGEHVAHAEDARRHAVWMERLKRFKLLAHADELDRAARDRLDRQRRTASGVAVELRQNDAVDAQPLVEALGHVHGILTRHGIDDEQDLVRLDVRLDILKLLHELFINVQTTRRIDDHDIVDVRTRIFDRTSGNRHGIRALRHGKDGDAKLLAQHLELLDSRRSIDIGRNEQRFLSLLLERKAELSRRGRLARALKSRHHDDGRRHRRDIEAALRAAHEFREFLVDNLDDDLRRCQGIEHILPDGAFLHLLDEILDDLEIDVGFEECHAHLAHRLVYVVLRQLAMSAQLLECLLQAIRQAFKNHAVPPAASLKDAKSAARPPLQRHRSLPYAACESPRRSPQVPRALWQAAARGRAFLRSLPAPAPSDE